MSDKKKGFAMILIAVISLSTMAGVTFGAYFGQTACRNFIREIQIQRSMEHLPIHEMIEKLPIVNVTGVLGFNDSRSVQ